jgi:hypothetical protein
MNRMVYAVVWAGAIITAIALTEALPVTGKRQYGRISLHVIACLVMTVVWAVAAYYACLAVVPGWVPMPAGGQQGHDPGPDHSGRARDEDAHAPPVLSRLPGRRGRGRRRGLVASGLCTEGDGDPVP